MQIYQVRSLRHTILDGKFCEDRNLIYFVHLCKVLIKNLKINMQSVNTCELNAAPEIFKQKDVSDPLR